MVSSDNNDSNNKFAAKVCARQRYTVFTVHEKLSYHRQRGARVRVGRVFQTARVRLPVYRRSRPHSREQFSSDSPDARARSAARVSRVRVRSVFVYLLNIVFYLIFFFHRAQYNIRTIRRDKHFFSVKCRWPFYYGNHGHKFGE